MSRRISDLNPSERDWIATHLRLAREIATTYGSAPEPGDRLDPAALDAAWRGWLGQHDRDTEDANPYINGFGIALGQHLVERLGLEWRVVEDEHGTEMAVWGEVGDVLVFPPNLVGKRYVAGTIDFFVPVAAQIEDQVRVLREQASAEPRSGLGRFFRRNG